MSGSLLERDYDLVSFHATGLGDRAAVDLVSQGFFEAFIDLVPASFSEYLFGGNRASGPNRLDAALHEPIPYILAPCGFDMISCGPSREERKAMRSGFQPEVGGKETLAPGCD